MKSITSVKQSDILEKWYLIDARGARIGKLASITAQLLLGKNDVLKRDYHEPKTKVVIINADKLDITEKRGMTKFYKSYSGFPGGLRYASLKDLSVKHPEKPIESAIKGMLPRTKRGKDMMANVRIYTGEEHKHQAQELEKIDLQTFNI